MDTLSLSEIYAILRSECAKAGGQAKWASAHGISPQHVNDVLNARRDPGNRMMDVLGLGREHVYFRKAA